jgi:uncharacterized membrane protein YesL
MRLGSAIRQSLVDFYFNSWRLLPANLAWGLALGLVLVTAAAWPPAVTLLPFVAIPVAGIHRMAALIARGEAASFSDFVEASRRFALPAVALGAAAVVCGLVLATNVVLGLQSGGPIGWFLGASAFYGLIGLAMFLVAAWPILVDPVHEALPVRRRLLLAGLVMVGKPVRLLALTVAIALILVVSTLLLAVVVMVAIALTALIASRVVLPTLDELEARVAEGRPG